MPSEKFRYILRYSIDPSFHFQDRLEELLDFSVKARIDEVMLFDFAEELSCGHPSPAELEGFAAAAKKIKYALADIGIDLSLNPWSSTYGITRGRSLKPDQNFDLMVGENGVVNSICVCPLSQSWQDYITGVYSYLSKEIRPCAIWIEDDWRLHNHDVELGWGGCFCDAHLKLFSKRVGRQVTREELLSRILAPGEPHPWRKEWLALSRETLLAPAEKIRNAVKKASPSTEIGLMSSVPDTHSAEGRDWHALQRAFAGDETFLIRPHIPSYTENYALQAAASLTRCTIANLHKPLKVYPELESSPRCGCYSKSAKFAMWRIKESALYGSDGITINHFDVMGNGTLYHRDFYKHLSKAKSALDSIAELNIEDSNSLGVNVLFHPEVSTLLQCRDSSSMYALSQDSLVWSKTLYILGISHKITSQIDETAGVYAVSGQTLRCFDDEDIKKLLAGMVFLDGESVMVLLERGFGRYIGIDSAKECRLSDYAYSYEEILEDNASVYGIARPRMNAQRCADYIVKFSAMSNADIKTHIKKCDHSIFSPGMTAYTNEIGGRIISLAYPLSGKAQFFMAFFNVVRKQLMQDILLNERGSQAVMIRNHPMNVYAVRCGDKTAVGFFNVISDDTPKVDILATSSLYSGGEVLILDDKGKWRPAEVSSERINDLYYQISINKNYGYLDGDFILF